MNKEKLPYTRVRDMSPDLRAKFRYDIRSGMKYEDLQQKYIVAPADIVAEKRLLGLPVRSLKKRGSPAVPAESTVAAPKDLAIPRQASPEYCRLAAARLREDYAALTAAGYRITVVDADNIKIEKVEAL